MKIISVSAVKFVFRSHRLESGANDGNLRDTLHGTHIFLSARASHRTLHVHVLLGVKMS